jgi:hypothetical protein
MKHFDDSKGIIDLHNYTEKEQEERLKSKEPPHEIYFREIPNVLFSLNEDKTKYNLFSFKDVIPTENDSVQFVDVKPMDITVLANLFKTIYPTNEQFTNTFVKRVMNNFAKLYAVGVNYKSTFLPIDVINEIVEHYKNATLYSISDIQLIEDENLKLILSKIF